MVSRDIRWHAILLVFGFFLASALRDNDLFWHLRVGEWIVSQQILPSVDLWTAVGYLQPWRPYSWLFELTIGLGNAFGGLSALVWLQLLLAIGYSYALVGLFFVCSNSAWFSLLLTGAAVLGSAGHFSLRPQAIVWLLFCFLLTAIQKNINERGRVGSSIALIALFIAWSNIHLSAVIGIATLALWGVDNFQQLRSRIIPLIVSLLSTCVTPHCGGEWLSLLESGAHPLTHKLIAEFQSATLAQFPTAILFLFWLVYGVLSFKVKQLPKGTLAVMLGLTAAGCVANKFIPFALIVVLAGTAQHWTSTTADGGSENIRGRFMLGINRFLGLIEALPPVGFSFLVACCLYLKANKLFLEKIDSKIFPSLVSKFIADTRPTGTILTSFGMGGFVGYAIDQAHLEGVTNVAYDGRTNVITSEVWHEIEEAEYGTGSKGVSLLTRFKPPVVIWNNKSAFVKELRTLGWKDAIPPEKLRGSVGVLIPPPSP